MAEHENFIGETSEWYTPPAIFNALGLRFDLDPCSPGPGHWVPARKIFTQAEDGLAQPWSGLVFCNPPFGGRNGHVPWMRRFFEHANGILITRSYTSSRWWHEEMPRAQMVLFPAGKTKFIRPDGSLAVRPDTALC
jgi:DNA N-6-adenine-methyltransferase (Dam)